MSTQYCVGAFFAYLCKKTLDKKIWPLFHNPKVVVGGILTMTTYTKDYFSPNDIKNILDRAVKNVEANINCYCLAPDKDFTRVRKLPFSTLFYFLMQMSSKSMNSNICDYFNNPDEMPSPAAICQRRKLLYPDALRRIMRLFTDGMNCTKTYNGYHMLACDGTDVNIPYNSKDSETYHSPDRKGSKGYNQLHLNALYDIENGIFQDAMIDTNDKTNETYALEEMIKNGNYPDKSIIIADRGYEKYNLFALCNELNQKFVIRVKDISSNGILSTLSLQDEEFDIDIIKTMTRLQTMEVKKHPEKYVRIMTSSPDFEYLKIEGDYYDIPLRITRFKITDTTYECLVTNLDRNEFPFEMMKEIYHKRWSIEVGFRELKYPIGMISFCSKKQVYLRQEIYASLILYNFTKFIIMNTNTDSDAKKYKLNFNTAVTMVRKYLKEMINEEVLLQVIKKFLTPLRPGRSFIRNMKPKSAISLAYKFA